MANVICLTPPAVNNPNPSTKSERIVLCEKGALAKNPGFFYRFTKDSNVDPAEVSKKDRILLANLFQSSRSTLSCISFPRVFAFQAGRWGTPISTLLNSPTVSDRFVRPHENSVKSYSEAKNAGTSKSCGRIRLNMASKEVPSNIDIYSNNKGYTHEQIDRFNDERVWTAVVAIMQDDGAETHPQTGTLLFSERQKRRAEYEQELRENPALAEMEKKMRDIFEKPLREIEENPGLCT